MNDTRERIIDVSAELFRRRGYVGTGMKRIVADSGAPFGSLYHFFPGGKDQLAEEVIQRSGEFYLRLFEAIFDAAPDVATAVTNLFDGAAATLRATGYADACPIATVALEVASTNEPLRIATDAVFESWVEGASQRLASAGIPQAKARALAISTLAILEGAFMLSRAARTTEAMSAAGATACEAVRAALPRRRSTPRR